MTRDWGRHTTEIGQSATKEFIEWIRPYTISDVNL